MKHARSQSGNVFFLVLLGIALFVAFTWAVTQSSSKSGSLNPDLDKVAASQIVGYGESLKTTIDTLRGQGVGEGQISFANNTVTGYGTVGANPSAEVFNISGGGMTYEKPNGQWIDPLYESTREWGFYGRNAVRDVGTPIGAECEDVACNELIALLGYIRKSICIQINNNLGVTNPNGVPPRAATPLAYTKFTGTYGVTKPITDNNSANSYLAGRTAACVEGGGTPDTGTYHYYQVLIAR